MTVVGETLRRERTRRSLNLDQISRQTKISVRLLEAIENEQFDKLPGGVFTKSFVKQYARALGLDEEEIGNELDRLLQPAGDDTPRFAAVESEPSIRMPRMTEWEGASSRPNEGSWLAALALVVAVMLVCSGFYAWWQRSRRPTPREIGSSAAVVTPSPVTEPARAPEAPSAAKEARPEPAVTQAAAGQSAGAPAPQSAAPPGASAAEGPPPAAGSIGNPAGTVQVTLRALEPVWVKAWVDGKVLLEGTLRVNESRSLGASEDVRLRVGNAGGIDVALNGKELGPLGPKGQIRVVQFTPKGLEVVPVKPPAPQGPPDIL